MSNRVVIGSINLDRIYRVNELPLKGETINAKSKELFPGGKGFNQAVAVSKVNSNVKLIGKIGKDESAEYISKIMKNTIINSEDIAIDVSAPTGEAIILVDDLGHNMITVVNGANMKLSINDIPLIENSVVLMQLEIPMSIIMNQIDNKIKNNNKLIINFAPFRKVTMEKLRLIDVLILNEIEAQQLVDNFNLSFEEILLQLSTEMPSSNIIITLGSKGVIYSDQGEINWLEGHIVKTVDTTGAGDTFVGVLTGLFNQMPFKNVIKYSNAAAAISTTRVGAQSAMPTLDEIECFLGEKNDKYQ